MNLDFFNKIADNVKTNNLAQNFANELSNYLEKNNSIEKQDLKQDGTLYQVVDMGDGYAYLQNVNNNKVTKEDIPEDILNKIGNDTILRYEDGSYVIEEELTEQFMDSLVGIQEFEKIKNDFINESGILNVDANTRYKIELKEKDYTILSYQTDKENTMKVPNCLIPFWAKEGESLFYKKGKFLRNIE